MPKCHDNKKKKHVRKRRERVRKQHEIYKRKTSHSPVPPGVLSWVDNSEPYFLTTKSKPDLYVFSR